MKTIQLRYTDTNLFKKHTFTITYNENETCHEIKEKYHKLFDLFYECQNWILRDCMEVSTLDPNRTLDSYSPSSNAYIIINDKRSICDIGKTCSILIIIYPYKKRLTIPYKSGSTVGDIADYLVDNGYLDNDNCNFIYCGNIIYLHETLLECGFRASEPLIFVAPK